MTDQEIELLLNQALKDMFYSVLRLQEKSVSKLANGNLSRTEMHALEIVQDIPDATLTQIADVLGITKATVSVSVNRLVEKGFLVKTRAEDDKRKSILKLTYEGEAMCKKHTQFHDMLIQAVIRDFQVAQYPEVLQSMQALVNFFNHLRAAIRHQYMWPRHSIWQCPSHGFSTNYHRFHRHKFVRRCCRNGSFYRYGHFC